MLLLGGGADDLDLVALDEIVEERLGLGEVDLDTQPADARARSPPLKATPPSAEKTE
ncbi:MULTISPECIES: hypothetical protein [unclassified Pseudonocardia]|uniref:hypothetical protein n=1 Tax=unclassified Pseudonocardia TaxID=2619320 RepID=UPI00143973AD|nr:MULTISPECIES: hypothetical protein [unclassified Pseudonocardia]